MWSATIRVEVEADAALSGAGRCGSAGSPRPAPSARAESPRPGRRPGVTSAREVGRPRRAPVLAAALAAMLGARALCAQSLTGTTGLVSIPTAVMPADRTLTLAV